MSNLYNLRQLKNYLYQNPSCDFQSLSLNEAAKKWLEKEIERINNLKYYENQLYQLNLNFIAGVDEAGRGPLVGPVVAACVILPKEVFIPEINDSKKLSEKKRKVLSEVIKKVAISYAIGIVDCEEIDKINILNATYKAMQIAISKIQQKIDYLLVDAITVPQIEINQKAIVKGDSKSISIAAASILAKVERDKMMKEYHKIYPQYNFEKNKGYGTKEHIEALKKYGPCPIHRKTFIEKILKG
ncbi:RNase HII [Thermoanaerobacter uzonensis DSM 18761]|uniref:Ribonuclease HII n=1 Tax=Thermoanaerobacter uzonensis DSM 18761 TaxID=1123369 RepID=A0A1M4UQD8_9THEO|nr:ribonuclease HII [Thermoanaerobacter uzonensis]SHE58899.1 RNase HII [Thermoanaerobacter uzonensis DSM 18761]